MKIEQRTVIQDLWVAVYLHYVHVGSPHEVASRNADDAVAAFIATFSKI